MATLVRKTPVSAASVPAPHQAQPQPAHLTSLPVLDDRPCSLFPLPSSEQAGEPAHGSVAGWDRFGRAEVAAVTWLRSSWWDTQPAAARPERQSHCSCCLLSTSNSSMVGASPWWWLSSCSSCHLGSCSRSVEEKQEEPCVSAQLGELLQREAELGGAEAGCESVGLHAELAQGLAPGTAVVMGCRGCVSQASAPTALGVDVCAETSIMW